MARRPPKEPPDPPGDSIPPQRQVFAANLKRLRLERGLKQTQLAELSGITQGHFSQLETGSWEPRLATILALAKALGVQPGDLLPSVDINGPDP